MKPVTTILRNLYGGNLKKGQTMTEYALLLGAVALAVFVTYQQMGNDTGSVVDLISNDLSTHHHHHDSD